MKKMKRIRLLTSMLILSMVLTNSAFAVSEPERGKDIFVEQCVATAVAPKAMYSKQMDYKGATVSNEGGYCQIEIDVYSTVNIQNGQFVSIDNVKVYQNGASKNLVSMQMNYNDLHISYDRQKITGFIQINLITQTTNAFGNVMRYSTYSNVDCEWSVK